MISIPQEPSRPADYPAGAAAASHPSHSPVLVMVAWAVVTLPAAWGIYMTVKTSTQLFHPTAPAHAAVATPAAK